MGLSVKILTYLKIIFFSYYRQLLGTKSFTWLSFSESVWNKHEKVLHSKNIALTVPFTEEEIKTVIFSMNPNKVLGSDDFPILFYQRFWDIIKYNILQLFFDFYHHKLDIANLVAL
jgi:hypothetical protein